MKIFREAISTAFCFFFCCVGQWIARIFILLTLTLEFSNGLFRCLSRVYIRRTNGKPKQGHYHEHAGKAVP